MIRREYRAGRVVGSFPSGYLVARQRPQRSFVPPAIAGCETGSDLLSPDGTRLLCEAPSENAAHVYLRAHLGASPVIVRHVMDNSNDTMFAWLDNHRFAVTVYDRSCPYAGLYDFFPSRIAVYGTNGRRLSTGACAFGVVAGHGRMALIGERENDWWWNLWQNIVDDERYWNDGYESFHHTWSLDGGKTWHDGAPLLFDGNGTLLYETRFNNPLQNVWRIQWSR
ncbi:MAG: hypothetical protein HKL91_04610 [Candidatus Eremiobacteraeota bacterium]|nr:hypothetical protein [Candidatus Eremiobacteraeota bacterium]